MATSTPSGAGRLFALSPEGTVRWSSPFDDKISAAATGSSGSVYFESNGTLYAVSPNGTERWSVPVGSVVAMDVDRSVVVGTFDGRLVAVRDGQVRWTYDAGAAAAPTFGPNGTAYAVTPESVVAVRDGDGLWETDIGATVVQPPGVGSHIYVGTQVNRTYALAPDGSIAWINRYETTFGEVPWSTHETDPPAFLSAAKGTPTRTIPKEADGASEKAPSTIDTSVVRTVMLFLGMTVITLLFALYRHRR